MIIALWGAFAQQDYNKTEEGIKYALEQLGHKVLVFDEEHTVPKDLIQCKADLLIFFKGGIRFGVSAELLSQTLQLIDYPKVCWFWDKVWYERYDWMNKVALNIDLGFLSDGTFIRQHNFANLYDLHQSMDERQIFDGKVKKEYKCDITFTGQIYNDRADWANEMKSIFGNRFKIVSSAWGKDLNDVCASAKIITAPKYPQDDFYWSQRPYQIMGCGGFLIHPYLEGLAKQFKEGKEIEFYRNMNELQEKVNFYLEHETERERIRKNGQAKVKAKYTFRHTIEDIISKL